MNRRSFLGVIPMVLAGCNRATAPVKRLNFAEREQRLVELEPYRVQQPTQRTTPKPIQDVLARFPEMRPLAKVAIRLHPRFGNEPSPTESKLGGTFAWSATETWPLCPEFRIPMTGILQLRISDAPPQFPMRPKSNLFQLFWTPRSTKAGPPHVVGVWKNLSDIQATAAVEIHESADLGYVPVPCLLIPERVTEFPPQELMPTAMRTQIEQWIAAEEFGALYAAAPGTKVGGWPRIPDRAPKCFTCVRPMDYLLTIAANEWTSAEKDRWMPMEDRDEDGYRSAASLNFGAETTAIQIYLCRRCESWPLRAISVSMGASSEV